MSLHDHQETNNYLEGLRLLREQKAEQAASAFSQESSDSDCFVLAQGNLAQSLVLQNKYEEAQSIIESIDSRIDSECWNIGSRIHFRRVYGEAIAGQGRPPEAIPYYKKAIIKANELIDANSKEKSILMRERANAQNSLATSYLMLDRGKEDLECARALLNEARQTHLDFPDSTRVGEAQTLTNLGQVLRKLNKLLEAELALREALDVIETTGDLDQRFRTLTALMRIGSSIVIKENWWKLLQASIDDAKNRKWFAKAHQRSAIAAHIAFKNGESDKGLAFVVYGRDLESYIDQPNLTFAQIRHEEASLLLQESMENIEAATSALIEGCFHWYSCISGSLESEDFGAHAEQLHNHFRFTSELLLTLNRAEEALFVFESGRSLHHATQVDPSFLNRTVAKNPFSLEGKIDCEQLNESIKTIQEGDCAVVLAILPKGIIGFIVTGQSIETVRISLDPNRIELLANEVRELPFRLQQGEELSAIPTEIKFIAKQIAQKVGSRIICGLTPHFWLHGVPWRVVLRHNRMTWKQLLFPIEYAFLLRHEGGNSRTINLKKLTSLGHGTTEAIDLNDEAQQFAESFDVNSDFIENATSTDLTIALQQSTVVFVSCHGTEQSEDLGLHLSRDGGRESELSLVANLLPSSVATELAILSACDSGVYLVADGDFPVGGIPILLRAGVRFCIGSRFAIRALFTQSFFETFKIELLENPNVVECFVATLEVIEKLGTQDLWRDLACIDLFGGP